MVAHEAYSADICDEKLFRSDINTSWRKINILYIKFKIYKKNCWIWEDRYFTGICGRHLIVVHIVSQRGNNASAHLFKTSLMPPLFVGECTVMSIVCKGFDYVSDSTVLSIGL